MVVGQVPPPPAPLLPDSNAQSPPTDPQAQRKWLLDHLSGDLRAQGKLDPQKRQDIERMINGVTGEQLRHAVQYYQQRKAEQLAEAEANLYRLRAYRDYLKREVERRKQVYQQEQAQAAYGSALAQQQLGQFYFAPFYANPPFYYLPRHHRHW